MLCYIMLYHTILYYIILYYTILYYIIFRPKMLRVAYDYGLPCQGKVQLSGCPWTLQLMVFGWPAVESQRRGHESCQKSRCDKCESGW